MQSRVYSLVAREFRNLNDFKVVSYEDCEYILSVVTVNAKTSDNTNLGYIASINLASKVNSNDIIKSIARLKALNSPKKDYQLLRHKIKQKLDSSSTGLVITGLTRHAVENLYQSVLTDSDLKNLANRIVADVDYEGFEDIRKMHNELEEMKYQGN